MNEDTFLQTIENSYKENDDGEFSTLSVLLTPMDLLKSDERYARAKLYQTDAEETELDIIHDRFNEEDNKALEVYYDKTFIGYVRKRFDYEYIDNTELVDQFCFDDNKLRDIQISWDGVNFIIKGKSFEKIQKIKEEKEKILESIRGHGDLIFGQSLKTVSTELQDDKELVYACVNIDGRELKYASERLKNDPEIVWIANRRNPGNFEYTGEKLLSDKSFVLTTIEKGMWWVFSNVNERLKSDKEVATAAIEKNILNIRNCSKNLHNNTKFMLMAIKEYGSALEFADKQLQNNKEVVMIAVNNDASALQYASELLKNDIEVVLAAVSNNGNALAYAGKLLKNDYKVVFAAVSNNGNALAYASSRLLDNKSIVLAALANTGYVFEYVSERLRNDIEVLLVAISSVHDNIYSSWSAFNDIFKKTSEENLKNKFFLLSAIKNNIPILDIIRDYLWLCQPLELFEEKVWIEEIDDKDIILMANQKFGGSRQLDYASQELLSNKDFALDILRINSEDCLEFFSDNLKNDKDVVTAAILESPGELKSASEILRNDKIFILDILSKNPSIIKYVAESLKNDKEVVLAALKQDKLPFWYISDISDNPDIQAIINNKFDKNTRSSL